MQAHPYPTRGLGKLAQRAFVLSSIARALPGPRKERALNLWRRFVHKYPQFRSYNIH